MTKLPAYQQIQNIALEIIAHSPGGIHYGELIKKVATENPGTPIKTIQGSVWDLATKFPDLVIKPSRGLFMPANAESSVEVAPVPIPKVKEESFYGSCC